MTKASGWGLALSILGAQQVNSVTGPMCPLTNISQSHICNGHLDFAGLVAMQQLNRRKWPSSILFTYNRSFILKGHVTFTLNHCPLMSAMMLMLLLSFMWTSRYAHLFVLSLSAVNDHTQLKGVLKVSALPGELWSPALDLGIPASHNSSALIPETLTQIWLISTTTLCVFLY